MNILSIGSIIRRQRVKKGITQEALCRGICNIVTLSRFENGKQQLSHHRLLALMDRLDFPSERYYGLLTPQELDYQELYDEIIECNVNIQKAALPDRAAIRQKGLAAIARLEALAGEQDTLTRQLVLRSKVLLGSEEGAYPLPVQREMLLEALRLTSPKFNQEHIGKGLYTTEEIKIISQLAGTYSWEQDRVTSLYLYRQLYHYIQNSFQKILPIHSRLLMVGSNYARELLLAGFYQDALEIAQKTQSQCLQYNNYQHMPLLLSVMADTQHFLGNDEASKELYIQGYYLCKIFQDHRGIEAIRQDAKRYLSFEWPD